VCREEHVFDASAPLCLLFDQPGADRVERALPEACISAANLAEVIAMLVDRGLDGNEVLADLRELDLEVVALDRAQAEAAGLPRSATRDAGLSLGDWAGLARSAFEVPDPWRPGGLILLRPLHRSSETRSQRRRRSGPEGRCVEPWWRSRLGRERPTSPEWQCHCA
jgi:ribonuclease VapC